MEPIQNQVTFQEVEERELVMPTVGKKKFPYTAKGKAAAKKAAKATPTNKQPKKKGPVRAKKANKQPIPPALLARLKKKKES